MTPLFFGLLESLGIELRLTVWAILLITVFYIWRMLKVGSKLSNGLAYLAVSLVVIATGLASGVLTGVDVGQLWGIVNAVVGVGADLVGAVL